MYRIYVSAGELALYNAMNCRSGKYLEFLSSDASGAWYVEIKDIVDKFGRDGSIFIGVIAYGDSTVHNETYRYIYPYQQVPISLLIGEKE